MILVFQKDNRKKNQKVWKISNSIVIYTDSE